MTGLVRLQKTDKELQALEELRGDLPQQVEEIKEQLEATRQSLAEKEAELGDVRKNKAMSEGELNDLQEKAKKYREQLYAVTSNREYDAITAETDAVAERISETENRILEFLEREDVLGQEITALQPQITELEEHLSQKETELQGKIRATEVEYEALQAQRKQLEESVGTRTIYQYERIRKGLGNNVVAELRNGACTGCFSYIPPQRQVEIKAMKQIHFCESCGRILVPKLAEVVVSN